ncbi:MAG: hypothetical protein ABL932_07110 [Terricaulis sp.]
MAEKKVGADKTPPLKKPGAAGPTGPGRAATPLNPNNPGKTKK